MTGCSQASTVFLQPNPNHTALQGDINDQYYYTKNQCKAVLEARGFQPIFLMNISRRDLLKVTSASGLVAAGLAASEGFLKPVLAQDEPTQVDVKNEVAQGQTQSGEMIYRTLGRTGERVSAIGLGGHHIGRLREEQESIKLIRSAIDRGINFMDNSKALLKV